ncbi:MAG: nuclear transport factor 2 family protein, partial [Comamonadaceae bacterium]
MQNSEAHWIDQLACRTLVEASVRHVDDGDAPAFAALFTDDGVLVRPNGALIEGREAIQETYAQRAADRLTRHLVTNVHVTPEADGSARARSYVLLWTGSSATPADGTAGRRADARQLVGEFDDRLVRGADGAWRIQRRQAS